MSEQTQPPTKFVFDLIALQEALQIAQRDSATDVLKRFHNCLGQLLFVAVKTGNTSCVQKLLDAGADPDFAELSFKGSAEWAFPAYAAEFYFQLGHPAIPSRADILEEYCRGSEECDICHLKGSQESNLELAFKHEYCTVWSPLVFAIQNNNLEAAKVLIENGSSLFKDCGIWEECLHVNPVEIAILENAASILSVCIQTRFPINWCITPEVLNRCKPECLKELLKGGFYRQDFNRKYPLAIAAGLFGKQVPKGHVEPKPFSLKYTARDIIRHQLLQCNETNLFILATRQNLPLPRNLCEYIVCDFVLS